MPQRILIYWNKYLHHLPKLFAVITFQLSVRVTWFLHAGFKVLLLLYFPALTASVDLTTMQLVQKILKTKRKVVLSVKGFQTVDPLRFASSMLLALLLAVAALLLPASTVTTEQLKWPDGPINLTFVTDTPSSSSSQDWTEIVSKY